VASGSTNEIVLTTIPAQIKLDINEIVPPISRPVIKVTYDGATVNPSSQQSYLIKVDTRKSHTIVIMVTDEQGKTSKQEYTITSDVSPIIGVVKTSSKVGFDPLTVTLDASISQLNDPDDEVVYFTWDF